MSQITAPFATAFSGKLQDSQVPSNTSKEVRAWYLDNETTVRPPCISSSSFFPNEFIEHLMRNKKLSALGVKFVSQPAHFEPDQITNMEGALHTYLVPIVLGWMHGDYRYKYGHGVTKFSNGGENRLKPARQVAISALIQPDFENSEVMLRLASLNNDETIGQKDPPHLISVSAKQDHILRQEYDAALIRFMIYHLTPDHKLPSIRTVPEKNILTIDEAISYLSALVLAESIVSPSDPASLLSNRFVRTPHSSSILSLSLLYSSAHHQLQTELLALEHLAPQGYIYTFDPPAIFARKLSAQLLTRLQCLALRHLATLIPLRHMRVSAFGDYADPEACKLFHQALLAYHRHLLVMPKSVLFNGKDGLYSPPEGLEDALLVIHNNSDAFGQNIETEGDGMSLDGTIGAWSSAAASLSRDRTDLLDCVVQVSKGGVERIQL